MVRIHFIGPKRGWSNLKNTQSERTDSCGVTMMMSSNGNILRATGPLWGESNGHRHVGPLPPTQRPVTRNVDIFFDLRLN